MFDVSQMKLSCKHCGTEFDKPLRGRKFFCSKKCRLIIYYAENKDHLNEMNRRRYETGNGKASKKKYHDKNKEVLRVKKAEYYQEHKDIIIARSADFAGKNPEKARAYKAKYSATDRGREVDYEKRRRALARKRAAPGHFTRKQFRELCAVYENKCLCCGEQKKLEADHIQPLACEGSDDISNIQPLCRNCNAQKATDAIDYRPRNPMGRMFEGYPPVFNFAQ